MSSTDKILSLKAPESLPAEGVSSISFKVWKNQAIAWVEQETTNFLFLEEGMYKSWRARSDGTGVSDGQRIQQLDQEDPDLKRINAKREAAVAAAARRGGTDPVPENEMSQDEKEHQVTQLLLKRNSQLSKFIQHLANMCHYTEQDDITSLCTGVDWIWKYLERKLVVTNEEAQKEKDTAGEANDTTEEAREVGTNDALKKQLGLGLGLILLLFALCCSCYKIYDDSKPGRNFAKTVNQLQTGLCNGYYKNNLSRINLGPWSDHMEDKVIIEEMFISQRFNTDRGEEHSNLLDFFSWQAGASPKRLLVVGEQGAGKTTSIKFASRVWCKEVLQWKYRAALQLKYSFNHLHDKYGTPAWRSVSQYFHQIVSSLSSMIVFVLQNLSENYVQSITEVLQFFELKSVPELFLAFEFKDVCNKRFLKDIVKNVVVDIDISKISEVLDKGSETILLAFDGWDEYNSLKQDIGVSPEIDGIIKREERQNFNLIVTTRPWRSDDLLNTKRLQFKKVSITKFDTPKRNNFIQNFFQFYPPEQMAEDLISVLDNKASVVPKELETEPRMLLYICNMWRVDKKIREDKFVSSDLFWDRIWALMTGTYNMKYPEKKISQEKLKDIRRQIGDFVNRNPGEISFETFYKEFGKTDRLDLFFFGIYSTDSQDIPPWQLDQESEIKPTYNEMLKEEGRRRKIEYDEEERRKKQTWFGWF